MDGYLSDYDHFPNLTQTNLRLLVDTLTAKSFAAVHGTRLDVVNIKKIAQELYIWFELHEKELLENDHYHHWSVRQGKDALAEILDSVYGTKPIVYYSLANTVRCAFFDMTEHWVIGRG